MLAALLFVVVQGMVKSCQLAKQEAVEGQASLKNVLLETFAEGITDTLYRQFTPAYACETEKLRGSSWLVQEQIDGLLPFYEYLREDGGEVNRSLAEGAERAAAQGGQELVEGLQNASAVTKSQEPQGTDHRRAESVGEGQGAEPTGNTEQLQGAEQAEGTMQAQAAEQAEGTMQAQAAQQADGGMSLSELLAAENEAAMLANMQTQGIFQTTAFVPHARMEQVDLTALSDYETLLQQFYIVDANTSASSERLNVENFLAKEMTISKEAEGPQILIFHTHSQETFIDSVAGDESTSIMGVGDRLTQILQETYGYEVLHHRGKYDVDTRDDAYSEALPEIEQLLKDYPTIQVVIDLHRDQMPEGTKLVMDLDGRPTARFMFFNGLSRTKKTGNISYLHNENLDDNLAFSFQMQKKAMEYYPGLTRKIYLKGYRYNMHLVPKYLLVELGAQNNTVEEAMNACDPLAHILDLVLSGQ